MKAFARTYLGVFMAFLYVPILILIIFSFNESKGRTFTGFTGKWYAQLFTDAAGGRSAGSGAIAFAPRRRGESANPDSGAVRKAVFASEKFFFRLVSYPHPYAMILRPFEPGTLKRFYTGA